MTRLYPPRVREVAPSTRDLRAELNPEQYAAASHGLGPLLIIAGAGTGKTRTLVYRVAHLIDSGVPPERILLLTFTRRAAHEMLSRAERLVGSATARVAGGHLSTAPDIGCCAKFGATAGLPSDFTIMDQGDAGGSDAGSPAPTLGFAQKEKAISQEGNAARRSTRARSTPSAHLRRFSTASIRALPNTPPTSRAHLCRLYQPQAAAQFGGLRRPPPLLGADARTVSPPRRSHRRPVCPPPRGRIPGYQSPAGAHSPRDVPRAYQNTSPP